MHSVPNDPGRAVVADEVRRIDVGTFASVGALVTLDYQLFEVNVQDGEALVIEEFAEETETSAIAADQLRFNDSLHGDPRSWVGDHATSRDALWRLWYLIDSDPQKR